MRKIIKFTADWCQPCKALEPFLRQAEEKGFTVERVNVDKDQEMVDMYKVTSLPTTILLSEFGAEYLIGSGADTVKRIKQFTGLATE